MVGAKQDEKSGSVTLRPFQVVFGFSRRRASHPYISILAIQSFSLFSSEGIAAASNWWPNVHSWETSFGTGGETLLRVDGTPRWIQLVKKRPPKHRPRYHGALDVGVLGDRAAATNLIGVYTWEWVSCLCSPNANRRIFSKLVRWCRLCARLVPLE